MNSNRHSIWARIDLRAPISDPDMPDLVTTDDLSTGEFTLPIGDLVQRVTVQNQLTVPSGTFQIDLAPGYGESVAAFLKPQALCRIRMQRTPDPEETVMLGLVTSVDVGEHYGTANPVRTVSVRGRALSSLLTDHRWWFHHILVASGEVKNLPSQMADVSEALSDAERSEEANLRALGFLAIDETLFDPRERHPAWLMEAAWEFFVARDEPFIKLLFSDRLPLRDRLKFEAGITYRSFVDARARLVQKYLPTEMPQSSCWDLMRYFCEAPFTELFSDSWGQGTEQDTCTVIARKPPWAGNISYATGIPKVGYEGRLKPPGRGETLFDAGNSSTFWERNRDTIRLNGDELVSRRVQRGTEQGTYSLYNVQPGIHINSNTGATANEWQQLIPPIIDAYSSSPSWVNRVGLRAYPDLHTRYVPINETDEVTPRGIEAVSAHCRALAGLLREWHYRAPEMWRGSYQVKGSPRFRVGRRLVDESLPREYYLTGVTHAMDFAVEQPSFVSTLQVDRGWDLAGAGI